MSAVINLDSSDEDNEVVEVPKTTSEVEYQPRQKLCFNPMVHIWKSQGFLTEFIDLINLCFNFENSKGMERILTRNLIPNYEELDNEYAKSDKLKCFLRSQCKKLKHKPNLKFSCLKEISEHFKANKMKKKVNFVTLNTKASDKFKKYHRMENERSNNKKPDDVIILDENDDPEPQIINLDDELNSEIDLESCEHTNSLRKNLHVESNDVNSDKSSLSNATTIEKPTKNTNHRVHKESFAHNNNVVESDSVGNMVQTDNRADNVTEENMAHTNNVADRDCEGDMSQANSIISSDLEFESDVDDDNIEIDHTIDCNKSDCNENTVKIINTDSEEIVEIRSDTSNSIPANNNNYKSTLESGIRNKDLTSVFSPRHNAENNEISLLESDIKILKQALLTLEESEVTSDLSSPYCEAHKIKLLIINKYKKVCELRGETFKPRKCRQFQLQVKEGYPAGPARKVEEWLNTSLDENGEPSFPNLRDVIKCVWVANQEDGLGWDINKTYQEARILFSQCGHHLQRRRKHREWRDLLHTVKVPVDDDPADSDPQLRAKLEANRQLAKTKFQGIIDHYAKLEDDSRKPKQRIKISNVKSLSNTNVQTSCWEVPITGLIKITRLEPSNNEPNTDIEQENTDAYANNTQENSNNVDISNETSNSNIYKAAYDSVMINHNKFIESEKQRIESNKNPLQGLNYNDINTETTESTHKNESTSFDNRKPTSHVNSTLEQNSELKPPDTPEKVSITNEIKTDFPVTDNKHIKKAKVISHMVQNHNISSHSQTVSNEIDCPENMETEDITSESEELDRVKKRVESLVTMEIDQNTQNVNNERRKEETENAQIIDKTLETIASRNDDVKRTNDISTLPNDKSKIKCKVEMDVDFSEEDFDLLLDKNFSCDITASATVFDVEDTVVIIELTSSDSESDDDDCQLITL